MAARHPAPRPRHAPTPNPSSIVTYPRLRDRIARRLPVSATTLPGAALSLLVWVITFSLVTAVTVGTWRGLTGSGQVDRTLTPYQASAAEASVHCEEDEVLARNSIPGPWVCIPLDALTDSIGD